MTVKNHRIAMTKLERWKDNSKSDRKIFNQNYDGECGGVCMSTCTGRRQASPPGSVQSLNYETWSANKKKWNSCTAHKKNVFVTLYPAADDEFERFDSCRTGIRDGRLCVDVRSGKTLSRELEVIEEEDFLFVFFCALAGSWPFPKNNELRPSMTQDVD